MFSIHQIKSIKLNQNKIGKALFVIGLLAPWVGSAAVQANPEPQSPWSSAVNEVDRLPDSYFISQLEENEIYPVPSEAVLFPPEQPRDLLQPNSVSTNIPGEGTVALRVRNNTLTAITYQLTQQVSDANPRRILAGQEVILESVNAPATIVITYPEEGMLGVRPVNAPYEAVPTQSVEEGVVDEVASNESDFDGDSGEFSELVLSIEEDGELVWN